MISLRKPLHQVAACLTALAFLLSGAATAQTCFTLESELAYLQSRGGGSSTDRARYERAFREQANVLARTEAQARSAGCFGGFLFMRRDAQPLCAALVSKLRQMEDNLHRLDQLRRQDGDNGRERRLRQVRAMMADRGCGAPGSSQPEGAPAREPDERFASGTYRTLCVRTCDGYYFPVSYATSRDRLVDDARTCASMCEGTETTLFYHPSSGGGPETMVSIEGSSYASLPTAFRYRTSFDPSCTCRAASPTQAAGADERPSLDTKVGEGIALLPRPRPAPGEDPETLSNRAGGFVPGAAPAQPSPAPTAGADGRPVRIVGPSYRAAPAQEGILVAPVPSSGG